MTKSDDFFDITGAAEPTETPAGAPGGVDFDVFGNAEPPNDDVDITSEFTETLVVRKPGAAPRPAAVQPPAAPPAAPPADLDLDLDETDEMPAAKPAPAPTPAPAPAAAGGGKVWIAVAVVIVIAVAAWLLLG